MEKADIGSMILEEAPLVLYAAYLNAKNEKPLLERDEFLSKVPYNMAFLASIYTEFLGGQTEENKFSDEIKKATKSEKN